MKSYAKYLCHWKLVKRLTPLIRPGLSWVRAYPCRPIRVAVAAGNAPWIRVLPNHIRTRLDLDGDPVIPIRLELGGGPFPTPGYIHIDSDPRARHLEFVAPAWDLPFQSGSVQEILAVHVFEHIHPGRVPQTLREWRRVLTPSGTVRIHVPNASQLLPAFLAADPHKKWALISAILGMYGSAEISSPEDLDPGRQPPDHKAIYDYSLLEDVILSAGFAEVRELTGQVIDRHVEAWSDLVAQCSLVVEARGERVPRPKAIEARTTLP
jgi:SAM-dependent methyltransferase